MEPLDRNTGPRARRSADPEPSAGSWRPLVDLSGTPKTQLDLVFVRRAEAEGEQERPGGGAGSAGPPDLVTFR